MPLVPQEPKVEQPVLYLPSGGSTQAKCSRIRRLLREQQEK
jgi:hypothetical protein